MLSICIGELQAALGARPQTPEAPARSPLEVNAHDPRQEFELALGKGWRISDLSADAIRAIRQALPFAASLHTVAASAPDQEKA